jgi:periplasmic protein TonB
MGLVEFLRQWERGRLAAGVAVSILFHLVLFLMAVGIRLPGRVDVKRGEPLIVELPRGDDSPPPGDGGGPASKPSPPPAAPVPKTQARPAAPAPKVAAVPAPRPAAPARQPPPAPRPEPAQARQVPSAPAVPPADTGSVPAPQPAPAQPTPPQPAASQPPPSKPDAPSPPDSTPAESAPQPSAQRQVASLPPQPAGRAAPDTLSALRRGSGGAGGRGEGHAGIEGEPIALDSKDPRYSDYLDRVRRAIKEKWGFPCVKNLTTHECEYKTTQLIIEFGIAKDGQVPFVTVVRSSGYPIYDDYAVNAVKLAAPFPPIPDTFSKTGVPIHATFSYVVESSLANILR